MRIMLPREWIDVLKFKCVKKSLLASVIAWGEAKIWNRRRLEKYVSSFVCPSDFLRKKMISGGYAPEKLHYLHNFIDDRAMEGYSCQPKGDHYCFVGRLSEEKGIRTLLQVARDFKKPLKIFGTGPLDYELREQYKEYSHIQFMGHCSWNDIKDSLASARCMVLPSEWYENNPLTILEAFSVGTAVIGARIGGIPEMISEEENGWLFEPRSTEGLLACLEDAYQKTMIPLRSSVENFLGEAYCNEIVKLYNLNGIPLE